MFDGDTLHPLRPQARALLKAWIRSYIPNLRPFANGMHLPASLVEGLNQEVWIGWRKMQLLRGPKASRKKGQCMWQRIHLQMQPHSSQLRQWHWPATLHSPGAPRLFVSASSASASSFMKQKTAICWTQNCPLPLPLATCGGPGCHWGCVWQLVGHIWWWCHKASQTSRRLAA